MFDFFKKKKAPKTPLIEIWTQYGGLENIDLVRPSWGFQKSHLPDWWKAGPSMLAPANASMFEKTKAGTYKSCPGMLDFFKDCVVLPMWTDVVIAANKETGDWAFKCSMDAFKIEIHDNAQFLNHTPSWIQNGSVQVFKFPCPWLMKTPPGYSVLQLPMFYHFDRNFTVMAGTIRTDIYHEINQQVLFHITDNDQINPDTNMYETMIKAGTPLSMYIPFKREEYDLDIRDSTKEDYTAHMASRCAKLTFQQGYKTILQKQQKNKEEAEGTLG